MEWLTILSMIGSLASTGIGAWQSAEAMADAKEQLSNQYKTERAERNRMLNRGYVNSSDAQGLLRRVQELQRQQYERARATNVVAGGTDAHLAAVQQNNNKVVTDVAGNLASRADAWKDNLRLQQIGSDRAYAQQMFAINQNKAQNIAQAAGQATKAMAGIAGAAGSADNPYATASTEATAPAATKAAEAAAVSKPFRDATGNAISTDEAIRQTQAQLAMLQAQGIDPTMFGIGAQVLMNNR